jgi:hypothetical protein
MRDSALSTPARHGGAGRWLSTSRMSLSLSRLRSSRRGRLGRRRRDARVRAIHAWRRRRDSRRRSRWSIDAWCATITAVGPIVGHCRPARIRRSPRYHPVRRGLESRSRYRVRLVIWPAALIHSWPRRRIRCTPNVRVRSRSGVVYPRTISLTPINAKAIGGLRRRCRSISRLAARNRLT